MTNRAISSKLGYQLILVASLLYGSYGVWSRLMGPSFSPFYQAYVRSIVILLIMAPLLYYSGSFKKILKKDIPQLAVFVGFCIFTQVPLYYAFNNAPIGTVNFIFYAMLLIATYVMSKFYLKESITKIKIASILLALTGLILVFGISVLSFAPLGLGLAALNGVASGSEGASSKKLTSTYPPGLIIFWGWAATLLTHLPLSLLLNEPQPLPQFDQAWLYLLIYSVVNAAAFWIAIAGFRHVDASIGSLIGLTEVLFAALFGYLLFDERIGFSVGIGGLLIIFAAMLPDLTDLLKHKRHSSSVETIREL